MSGRFLSQADMGAARHEMEIFDARIKRGEIPDSEDIVRLHHVVCGCGQEGCIFISAQRKRVKENE